MFENVLIGRGGEAACSSWQTPSTTYVGRCLVELVRGMYTGLIKWERLASFTYTRMKFKMALGSFGTPEGIRLSHLRYPTSDASVVLRRPTVVLRADAVPKYVLLLFHRSGCRPWLGCVWVLSPQFVFLLPLAAKHCGSCRDNRPVRSTLSVVCAFPANVASKGSGAESSQRRLSSHSRRADSSTALSARRVSASCSYVWLIEIMMHIFTCLLITTTRRFNHTKQRMHKSTCGTTRSK